MSQKHYINKNQANSFNNTSEWCMSSNATTIQASGIETTSQWRWLPSGACYNFGAGQDWHDSIWNIPPQNTGGENEQRTIINSNSFVATFQGIEHPAYFTSTGEFANLKIIGQNGYNADVVASTGTLAVASNSSENSYNLVESNINILQVYYTWSTPNFSTPVIANIATVLREDGNDYFCVDSKYQTLTEWSITPEVTDGSDNYSATLYPFAYISGNNCYEDE
ncbi:MAG: hypothetical protein ORN24_00325 [Burkholderiales bacterium]|nr:hypothetical protein [Burkholderiales bacterium]